MKKDKEEITTEEDFKLDFYPVETKKIELEISVETLEFLQNKAKGRGMSLKALLREYIGKGLREDMDSAEARELALKKLKGRKLKTEEVDLAA